MTTLKIPSPLRTYTEGQSEIDVQGDTVAEAMEYLLEQHPALRQHLFNEKRELRPFVNLYINQEDIRQLQDLATPVKADDRLMIVPSIAGGLSQVDHSASTQRGGRDGSIMALPARRNWDDRLKR